MNRIIVFSGPPLSGKSTLAAAYGTESNVPVLEMDSIRLRLMPSSRQSREDRNIAYGSLHYTAEQLVRCGVREIALVATYTRREIRKALVEMADRVGAPLYLLQFRVSAEAAARRFESRPPGHAAVDLTLQSVRDQARGFPYFKDSLIVETTSVSEPAALAMVVKYLNREKPLQSPNQWVDCALE